MKKVFLRTFGCQMNTRDSEVIGGLLNKAGFVLVDAPDTADVVIFNTCSVRQHAEDKVWSEIGRIAKQARTPAQPLARRPIIGLVGCMAQNYKDGVFQRSPYVDFAVGPADIAKIPTIVQKLTSRRLSSPQAGPPSPETSGQAQLFELKIWETDGFIRPEEIYHTGYHAKNDHAYVVISEGCENYCAYCVVPYTRGALRHRPHREIVREIEDAAAAGITKVTLLGQNVNAYRSPVAGGQSPVGFVDLLDRVNAIERIGEFSFITSHPKDTTEALFEAMARLDKARKYLHLPVQAGSNHVLAAMNRGYTREFYLDLADKYRKMVTGGALTTDIIVGFPGETEADFQETVDLVTRAQFDAAFIFKYSVRPHTTAASLPDDIPTAEKERRHAVVLELQRKISRDLQQKSKG